ncbi:MAG: hypothetical protein QGF67_06715 [Lentisphaeria bacterium]|jgi:hypothetical protein|nr:hypothetical protein [Lentisphaeria bacterium]MDP7741112.1 hypothetical protein [Lentisphaeria bacterium]
MKKLLGFVIAACLFAPGGVLGADETICPEAVTGGGGATSNGSFSIYGSIASTGGVSTVAGGNTVESTFIPQTIYGCTCQACDTLVDSVFADLCVQLANVSNLNAAQSLVGSLINGSVTSFDVCDDSAVPGVADSADCGGYIQQVINDHIASILSQ